MSSASSAGNSPGVTTVDVEGALARSNPSKSKRNTAIAVGVILAVGLVIAAGLLGMHFSGLGVSQAGFTTLYNKFVTAMNTSQSMSLLLVAGEIVVPTLAGTLLIGLVSKAIANRIASRRADESDDNASRGSSRLASSQHSARADDDGAPAAPATPPPSSQADSGRSDLDRYATPDQIATPQPSPGSSARAEDDNRGSETRSASVSPPHSGGDDDDDDGGIAIVPKTSPPRRDEQAASRAGTSSWVTKQRLRGWLRGKA